MSNINTSGTSPQVVRQTASPTTGQTVTMVDNGTDAMLWLTPAGTIAALTVTLPTEAKSRLGQLASVGSSQIITALTINGATTIHGNITTIAAAGNLYLFQKVAANTWARRL